MFSIWLKALRVNQWTKNAAVMLAWFFSVADASQKELARGFGSFMIGISADRKDDAIRALYAAYFKEGR